MISKLLPNQPVADSFRLLRKRAYGRALVGFSRAWLIQLIDDSEQCLSADRCETVKNSRSSMVVKTIFPLGHQKIMAAYKRIRRPRWWKRVTDLFRPHRASLAWELGNELLQRGIATPRPLAVVIPYRWKIGADAYLATEWIEGTTTLSDFLYRNEFHSPEKQRQRLVTVAQSLGQLLGNMHRQCVRHRDLKPSNLLVLETVDRDDSKKTLLKTLLVDLDGAFIGRSVARIIRCRNLARLNLGTLDNHTVTRSMRLRFLRAYLKAAGLPESFAATAWKSYWRHIQQITIVRSRRKQKRNSRKKQTAIPQKTVPQQVAFPQIQKLFSDEQTEQIPHETALEKTPEQRKHTA